VKEILNLFVWNPNDRRLRAFWRILIQGLVWFTLVSILTLIPLLILWSYWIAEGSLNVYDPLAMSNSMIDLMYEPAGFFIIEVCTCLATLVTVWLAGRLLDRRRFADFGFHFSPRWWLDLGFGLFLGAFLMTCIFLVESAAHWISVAGIAASSIGGLPFIPAILLALVLFVCVGISEELLSRGYQLKNMAEGLNSKRFGPAPAVLAATVLTSVFFGFLHLGNPNMSWISVFNLMAAGAFLALGYILTGDLAISIGLHITWNFFQGNIFGFPVSGLTPVAASLLNTRQGGPEWLTGGFFGPEGGLIGSAAMVLGSLMILLYVAVTRRKAAFADSLAQSPKRVDATVEKA
jgi:membrane protease YdiL (CAAX protease family)